MSIKYLIILLIFNGISLIGYAQNDDERLLNDSTIKISGVKTNTRRSDFGPAIVGDSLYFTSYTDRILGQPDAKLRKKAFYDLYFAKTDKDGNTISKREPFVEFLTRYHDGPVSYCEKTGELFVTQSDNLAATVIKKFYKKDTIRLRIIIAKRVKGKWTSITNFPYNNKDYSVGHPAISQTGDTLIFSCDRHGGFGETDLYYSIRKKGKWDIPVNMGPAINTSGKEEFSFIYHNHTGNAYLIFASTGRFGFGGLDIYYTKFPFNSNNKIEHFEAPINTPYDDFDMAIKSDADYGYITSNRPGTGSDDIYKFVFTKSKNPFVPFLLSPVKELYVYNSKTRLPIPGTSVISCDSASYSTDKDGKIEKFTNDKGNCEVLAQKYGYTDGHKLLAAREMKNGEICRDTVWMDPIMGKIVLHHVYYDFNKWDILPEAANELDHLVDFLNENPDFKAQLSSHTDSRGNDGYNLWLSQKRAESAVNYITSHGVSSQRITGRGYGETQLLNRCENGALCTPQEHRQNRRTEIFIPDYGKSLAVEQTEGQYAGKRTGSKYSYSAGNSSAQTYSGQINKGPTQSGNSSLHGYYLILNSFLSKVNAEHFLTILQRNGVQAEIVAEKQYFRVGINHSTLREAKEAKEKYSNEYFGCWVLM